METHKEMMPNLEKDMRQVATETLGRIMIFLVYYISLILIGISLFWGAIEISLWCFNSVLPEIRSGRIIIFIVLILLGIWGLAFMLGVYLVKPLFSFTSSKNKDRVEIFEKDAPELFAIIRELVQETQCKFPKHIYLNTNVNACVFYDTTFWSIFFPTRKNLEIGLGLFHSTNIDEVKSIIAHEFGHFSQKSMKIGSTVYVTNQVIYNLIYTEDSYERWMNKWCMSDNALWAMFGSITRFMTYQIKRLTVSMYKFVQRKYLRLSRLMEFEADSIACHAVGSIPFISAMYKIEYTDGRNMQYEEFLHTCLTTGKYIDNYWNGYSITEKCMSKYDGISLQVHEMLSESIGTQEAYPSNLDIKNAWASHPALKDRVEYAKQLNCVKNKIDSRPSWSLIPTPIKMKMSAHRLENIKNEINNNDGIEIVSEDDFKRWIMSEIETHFIPLELKPFFDRNIIPFNLEDELISNEGSPLNQENAAILQEYKMAINDWNSLQGIANGSIEVEEFRYNKQLYSKKELPLEEHKAYLQELHDKAVLVDKKIYSYVYKQSAEPEKIALLYSSIFYVHSCNNMFELMMNSRNNLVDELNRPVRREEDDITDLILQIQDTERVITKCLSAINYKLLSLVVKSETIEQMIQYAADTHNPSGRIDIDLVNEMIGVCDMVIDMHQVLSRTAYSMLIDEFVSEKKTN